MTLDIKSNHNFHVMVFQLISFQVFMAHNKKMSGQILVLQKPCDGIVQPLVAETGITQTKVKKLVSAGFR